MILDLLAECIGEPRKAPHAGCPILRAFVSCEGWGFRRSAIGQPSKMQPIFSTAYHRQYFYEYSTDRRVAHASVLQGCRLKRFTFHRSRHVAHSRLTRYPRTGIITWQG